MVTTWLSHIVFLLIQLLWLVMWHCHIVAICWHVRYDGGGWLTMVVGIGGHRQGGEAAAGGLSWKLVVVEEEAVEHC